MMRLINALAMIDRAPVSPALSIPEPDRPRQRRERNARAGTLQGAWGNRYR